MIAVRRVNTNPITSLAVFNRAAQYMSGNIVSVSRLDSANHVWLSESKDGQKLIFKYFSPNDHAHQHFHSELRIYLDNPSSSLLPRLVDFDIQRNLLVLEFIERTFTPTLSLADLINQALALTSELSFDSDLHQHLPGIVGTWNVDQSALEGSEQILLAAARATPSIAERVDRLTNNWSRQCHLHGDLKIANFLFTGDSFRIIDWESHCTGPTYWDTAGVIQSAILEIISHGPYEHWCRQQVPIIDTYLSNGPTELTDALITRLVQSSLEASQTIDKVSVLSANLLQISDFISRGECSFLEYI
jgi:hypothetical protein